MNAPLPPGLGPLLPAAEATLAQSAYEALRRAIMIGRIPPGEPLRLRAVAAALGVSLTPARSALARLSAEGALADAGHGRMLAPGMTPLRFTELIELRAALEGHAASRAFPYVAAQHISAMQQEDEAVEAAWARGDLEGAIIANQAFHRILYEAHPEPAAMAAIESVWLRLGPFLRLALSQAHRTYTIDRHAEALEALMRRDPLALRYAIEADVREGAGAPGDAKLLEDYIASAGASARPPPPDRLPAAIVGRRRG